MYILHKQIKLPYQPHDNPIGGREGAMSCSGLSRVHLCGIKGEGVGVKNDPIFCSNIQWSDVLTPGHLLHQDKG